MIELTSYRQWNEGEENLHSGDAMSTYKSGIDNDITMASEEENGIYAAYLERMRVRLEKHEQAYEQHMEGSMNTQEFVQDIALTRHLFEDWDAYAQRFEKLCMTAKKRETNGR